MSDGIDLGKFDAGGMVASQCSYCKHPSADVCTAFPAGIPDGILRNAIDHSRPVDGDHGIRFEPRDDVPPGVLDRLRRKLDANAASRRDVGRYLGADLGGEG